ncbi:hypothetical protein QFC21_004117 [Naganishia friedmannii]|uniref:Uncharacterized protein n=1 Tax=Naganishia friedmannii TaxID=89922 RepID=A0ACC2VJZ6_9TREE|nr:hypothetical protein QFC21_004117 [Naganishia friedmannii]
MSGPQTFDGRGQGPQPLTTGTSINAETVPVSEPGSRGSSTALTTFTDGQTTNKKKKNDKRKNRYDPTGTSGKISPWKKELMKEFNPTAPKPTDGSPLTWWNEKGMHCSEFLPPKRFEMQLTAEPDNNDFMECMTPLIVEKRKICKHRVQVFNSYVSEVLKLNKEEISDFRIQMKEECANEWKEYLDELKRFALTFRKWKKDNPDGEAERRKRVTQKRREYRQKRREKGDTHSLLSTNTTNQSMGSDEQMPDRVDSDLEEGSIID